jgi:A/G-specific adenine glycosylase
VSGASFSQRVLDWFRHHGRRDLPWQKHPTPYRIWVSEIMLQQTRVATVIPYYERFLVRFPDVQALARADLDTILHHWSGLGYYARARHLHAAARRVCERHGGCFPEDFDALVDLPGIGRSTAGAILALACGQRHPILDGNVKRVLARYHALAGWPGQSAVQRELWRLAEQATPRTRVAEYTQAMMDLGATVCTRSRPACAACPLAASCRAHAAGRQADFPAPRPGKRLPVRQSRLLVLYNPAGEILLERRPPAGVWGGLWSLPECPPRVDLARWCRRELGLGVRVTTQWPVVRHTFSHYHLDITPVLASARPLAAAVAEGSQRIWYHPDRHRECGFAAPVRRLLELGRQHITGQQGNDSNGAMRQAG